MQEDLLLRQRQGAEAAAAGHRGRQQEPQGLHQVAVQRQGKEVKRKKGGGGGNKDLPLHNGE